MVAVERVLGDVAAYLVVVMQKLDAQALRQVKRLQLYSWVTLVSMLMHCSNDIVGPCNRSDDRRQCLPKNHLT